MATIDLWMREEYDMVSTLVGEIDVDEIEIVAERLSQFTLGTVVINLIAAGIEFIIENV